MHCVTHCLMPSMLHATCFCCCCRIVFHIVLFLLCCSCEFNFSHTFLFHNFLSVFFLRTPLHLSKRLPLLSNLLLLLFIHLLLLLMFCRFSFVRDSKNLPRGKLWKWNISKPNVLCFMNYRHVKWVHACLFRCIQPTNAYQVFQTVLCEEVMLIIQLHLQC